VELELGERIVDISRFILSCFFSFVVFIYVYNAFLYINANIFKIWEDHKQIFVTKHWTVLRETLMKGK